MASAPQASVALSPSRAGQLLRGAGRLSGLITITPALSLIVAGVRAEKIGQGVSLEVSPDKADCMTVWFGYDPQAGNAVPVEFSPSPSWPASAADQPTRRIFAVVTWGAGGGQQYVEIDAHEGVGVTIPTATCEVYAYSEQTSLDQLGTASDPAIVVQPTWTVSVHAAPGRSSKEGKRTRQVVQPIAIPAEFLPPNDPPNRPREALAFKALDDGGGGGDLDRATIEAWQRMAIRMIQAASGGAPR